MNEHCREVVLLIAEDDAGHARLIEKNLTRAGLRNRIERFDNGQAVLDFLFRKGSGPHRESETPYLLLLDIRMPRVDGIEVLRHVKQDEELRKIPVIMLTTTDDPARGGTLPRNRVLLLHRQTRGLRKVCRGDQEPGPVLIPGQGSGNQWHRMSSEPAKPAVLVVDDDRGLVQLIKRALEREGFSAPTAPSGAAALAWLEGHSVGLMLLDLKLQDLEGRDLVEQLAQRGRCPPFIVITGQGDERVAVDMMKRGARDYLIKDAGFLQFLPAVVKRALGQLDNERRLAEAEQQVRLIRTVVDQGFSAVLITGTDLPDPEIIYINPAFAQATGCSQAQVVGRPLSTVASLADVQRQLQAGLPEGATFVERISTFQTPHGERWGEWRVGPVQDKAGKITHWLIIFRDITQRKLLEKEVLEISDQERRRIGQDLHDGLCQHLAGIELMSQVLEQKLAAKSKPDAVRAGEIARHVREAIGQTRSLARGLSPVTLESEGLVSALRELAANTERMFGLACHVVSPQEVTIQTPAVATHLYRIAQEAVSNAFKHGKASDILIRLESSAGLAVLSITDNGAGFDVARRPSDGMGLRIMEYRSGMIGGVLSITKHPRGGIMVQCSVPNLAHPAEPRAPSHRPLP